MKTVYYLDDEDQLCTLVDAFLSTSGFLVKTFTDEEDFFDAFKQSPPDLLIVDHRLKRSTGCEIVSDLTPECPVILVTGELESKKLECKGINVILGKPYRLNELKETILSLL